MQARWIGFGAIEIEGRRYEHDLVIDGGEVSRRVKGPSKVSRGLYGHTPLSAHERIPWGGKVLLVGTGAQGKLPVTPGVAAAARERGVEVVAEPTPRVVKRLRDLDARDVYAVVHVTC